MTNFFQDVRYAFRLLIKQPAFALITVSILALGIGATTAIFSVVDTVLLRPLPYADADRIVSVSNLYRRSGNRGSVSAPDYRDWRDQSSSFDDLAAYWWQQVSLSVGEAADYVTVAVATPEFFPLFRVRTMLGRLPDESEQHEGGPAVAVVSHAFWISHLGGDRTATGRTLKLRERLFTVVGVLTPEFRFPGTTDVWVPWWTVPVTTSRSAHNYRVVGRLKPGVSIAQAQSEMDGIAARLEKAYPTSNEDKGIAVDRLQDQLVRNVRTTLNLIFAVVVVVLLISCANVSNLLLARGSARTRELGVRAAMGAMRARVVRQLVTESAMLALVAGALGICVAFAGIRALVAIAPQGLPRIDEIAIDGRVLMFALAASIGASLIFGLTPALQTSRLDLNEVLKRAGRGAAASTGGRLRAALIVFEAGGAVALVIAASLLVRSFAALTAADMGFPVERLLLASTTVPAADIDSAKRATRFYRDLLPQLAAIPGVQSVAGTTAVPTQPRSNGGYVIEGGQTFEQLGMRSPQALFTVVTPGYFKTIGVAVKGRDFTDSDGDGAQLTAIVNEAFARAAFGSADPIGRRIMCGLDLVKGPDGTSFMSIVGVAADIRATDVAVAPQPHIYMPYQQHPFPATSLVLSLRTTSDPQAIANASVQKIRSLNPDVPVKLSTMEETVGIAVSAPRFRATLLGLFAAVALVLAMAGIYGVVSFAVSQRTSEIGLRMALGARKLEIVKMTVGDGLKLTAMGVVAGWAAALALSHVLASMLFEVPEHDPVAFAFAPALLIAVAALASTAPALRASRVDPSIALRVE